MNRVLTWVLLSTVASTLLACDHSTLREEVLEDSTFETSGGADRRREPHEPDIKWEEKYAPLPGEQPRTQLEPGSSPFGLDSIRRQEIDPVLEAGLGAYLQKVRTEPSFEKGRFVGFRILSLYPDDPSYASVDLRPGDVVTMINGLPIGRPDQASVAWDTLRTADELVVYYVRDEQPKTLRYSIVQ
jgi:type II secretory pathway component PulC